MIDISSYRQSPNALVNDYLDAKVGLKLLLTGHIQQALPNVAREAYSEHWQFMNKHGHECFELVFDQSLRIREGFAGLIQSKPQQIALASSVHDLFVRFLSCLDFKSRPRIITTTDEHSSILRQLVAIKSLGVELVVVDSHPIQTLSERLADALTEKTAAVCVSTVNGNSGQVVNDLDVLLQRCQSVAAELFLDAYLSVNVLNFNLSENGLTHAFVVGGGAKYCQMGDGVCFMHVPPNKNVSPTITGWYGLFDLALDSPAKEPLIYADIVASRFDGSTKDTVCHFRAEKVFQYFDDKSLDQTLLKVINEHQVNLLLDVFSEQDFDPNIIQSCTNRTTAGSFVAFRTPYASEMQSRLRDIGVVTDHRGGVLRFGPAPYLSDEQITDSIIALAEVISMIAK